MPRTQSSITDRYHRAPGGHTMHRTLVYTALLDLSPAFRALDTERGRDVVTVALQDIGTAGNIYADIADWLDTDHGRQALAWPEDPVPRTQ